MQRILTLALSALIISVTIASCSKQGPAGAKGAAGPAGAPGPAAPAGPKGNANIIYSAWVDSFSGNYANWAVPAITQGVMDSSAVLVYTLSNTGYPQRLPLIDVNEDPAQYINYELEDGYIIIYCGGGLFLYNYAFRYVIIPPVVAGTGMPRSYEEMTAWLGITP